MFANTKKGLGHIKNALPCLNPIRYTQQRDLYRFYDIVIKNLIYVDRVSLYVDF